MDKFTVNQVEGYTIMSNHHLRDKKLSHAARGLLSFMLSLPEDWDYSFNGLVAISKEGRTAIRNMINELKEAKYIKISRLRNSKGLFQYNYEVFPIPYDLPIKNMNSPTPGFPSTDNPTSDNRHQINTNKQIDKIDKTELKYPTLINELIKIGYIDENDNQKILYDGLFKKYIDEGHSIIDIYSAIHYIAPRVISRNFIDEEGKEINNKFGYLKASIESNIKKLNSYKDEIYPDDDNSPFWDDYDFLKGDEGR